LSFQAVELAGALRAYSSLALPAQADNASRTPEKVPMDINSIDQLKAALEASARTSGGPAVQSADPSAASPAASFGSALDKALTQVSELQSQSSSNQQAYQRGEAGVSLEQTMVSMQKSQVAFQAALTVRNRLVAAYTDIMNMQV